MNTTIQTIPLVNLAFAFIPVGISLIVLFRWSLQTTTAIYAIARMLIQLLLIGYFLSYIFETDSQLIIVSILTVMVISASWIALGTVKKNRWQLYKYALISILVGGGLTLALITQAVLQLDPWYQPKFMIPLAGMIFANSMNSVSLAAERLMTELKRGVIYNQARNIALQTSLIPIINSLFAVGLVSLPGMMTGQILSGVSPLIAVRYQIMVMCMIFGSAILATAFFLTVIRAVVDNEQNVKNET